MKKLFLRLVLLFVFSAGQVHSETAQVNSETAQVDLALGISDVLAAAFESAPQFLSARAKLEASLQAEGFANAALYPQIVYSYAHGRSSFSRTQTNVPSPTTTETRTDSRNESLRITQVLYDGEILSQRRLASLEAQEAEQIFREEAQRFYLRVIEAYINTLLSQEEYEAARFNVSFWEEQTRRVTDELAAGEVSRLELAESRSELDLAKAKLIETEGSLIEGILQLESLTGLKVSSLRGLSGELADNFRLQQDLATFEQFALNNNPSILLKKYSTARAKEGVELAQAGHYPRLSFQLSKSRQISDSINTINLDSDVESAQVVFNLPIFEGFRSSVATTQAGFLYAQARAELSATSLEILARLRNNYRNILRSSKKTDAYRTALDSAMLTLDATSAAARVGVAINADVLNVTQKLYLAKTELARVRHESVLRVLNFYVDLGSLDRNRLAELEKAFSGQEVKLCSPDHEYCNSNDSMRISQQQQGVEFTPTVRASKLLSPYLPVTRAKAASF